MWQSHFWAFKQTVWRTSQAASVATNKGYTSPQSEAVWLTHMRSSDHCSFVLSWTHKLKTHIILAVLSLSLSLVFSMSQSVTPCVAIVAVCLCSLLQCIFSVVRKPSEQMTDCWTDVPGLHPALLFWFWLKTGWTEPLHTSHCVVLSHTFMLTLMHADRYFCVYAQQQQQKVVISFINSGLFVYVCCSQLQHRILSRQAYSDV